LFINKITSTINFIITIFFFHFTYDYIHTTRFVAKLFDSLFCFKCFVYCMQLYRYRYYNNNNNNVSRKNVERENQQDETIRCLLSTSFSNMFRASLCPSSGEQRPCYCIWCTALVLLDVIGSGCGALRCRMRALLASYNAAQKLIINI